ncbi:MAG: DUF4194 domain-containing protein [Lachnospiraceae bacterium]|nr:DUF4194 domain-containing protein [Lachnospiraceae bacterium]MCI9058353.1 DUF4194 domain-containing protein [Lachnospiraceae bacterium]
MNIETYWSDYTSAEKDLFQKSCRRLLKSTFIVRDKDEENKKAYYFISKKPEPFSIYFGYIGFDILIDRDNGVIMLKNCADMGENGKIQSNRRALKKIESVVLCCLWTLYADRMRSGSLSQSMFISVADLSYELEKYGVKELIDNKKLLSDILGLFSRFNLLDLKGKIGDSECLIRLLPSLQFALDEEEFARFAAITQNRMAETNSDSDTNDTEEEDGADADE